MVLVLLPCKKKKGLIVTVVDVGNPDGATENTAVVELAVLRTRVLAVHVRDVLAIQRLPAIVEPVVGIEDTVLDDCVCSAVKVVGAVLGGKTLNAGGGTA